MLYVCVRDVMGVLFSVCIVRRRTCMWLTLGRASGRKKTLLQYSSLTPLERECYEGEVQPYRKMDYKPMMM